MKSLSNSSKRGCRCVVVADVVVVDVVVIVVAVVDVVVVVVVVVVNWSCNTTDREIPENRAY